MDQEAPSPSRGEGGGGGRVAVITGASRGLGAGLARRFAVLGIELGLCARSEPTEWADGPPPGSVARSVDVTDVEAVRRFTAEVTTELGPIDLWINNAGLLDPIGPLREADMATVAQLFEVNLLGTAIGSQAYVRHRRDGGQNGGVLINIGSGAGSKPYEGWAPYCASKAGVEALTRCIALEESGIGLRAHVVAPGVVDTDMQALIRATPAEQFPAVDRFVEMKKRNDFFTADHVADWLFDLAFGGGGPDGQGGDQNCAAPEVVLRVPPPRA